MDEYMDGWIADGQTDRQMDRRMVDAWMDGGWMDRVDG